MTHRTHSSKPSIFITNDDGVLSPGLHALASALQPFADLTIVAPSTQMTATGRGLFGDRQAKLETTEIDINGQKTTAYHAPCSPAQIVMLGIQILGAKRRPDLLISGINYGENVGRDITLSGTIGAAIQAVSMGIPALAVSQQTDISYHFEYGQVDWSVTTHFARKFTELLLGRKLPIDVDLLKIDVPQTANKETEWRITKIGNQSYFKASIDQPTLDSTLLDAQINVCVDHSTLDPTSDIYAVQVDKVVSVTPISLDMTSRIDLPTFHQFLVDLSEAN